MLAPNGSPCLVVDSSISGVTAHTFIPSRMCLPRIPMRYQQLQMHQAQSLASSDVAKAHRRIKIHPDDGGLPRLHFQNRLYRWVTLNFSARASGYYWGRVAGMLMRAFHRLAHVRHSMLMHVDDLLATLDIDSAPMYAFMIAIMCVCLGVPLSWKKTQLQSEVVWIGWKISTVHWTVALTNEKREAILDDLNEIRSASTRVALSCWRKSLGSCYGLHQGGITCDLY